MPKWILTKPVLEDETEALAFADECLHSESKCQGGIQGGAEIDSMPFADWIAHVKRYDRAENLPSGHVRSSCYFLRDSETSRIYGVCSVRWQLTPALLDRAGNIGYTIRPSERGKGLGSVQLGLALEKCREAGTEKALVTCRDRNCASAATALSQGGVEDWAYEAPDSAVFRRFWVPTGERVVLRRPWQIPQEKVMPMVGEFHRAGEDFVCGSSGVTKLPYADWLAKVQKLAAQVGEVDGRMPQHVYVSVLLPQETPLGFVAIRPELNKQLEQVGGHIGYSIRPSMRRKGYGGQQLDAALRSLANRGVERALITCDSDNTASAATILSRGGIEDKPCTLADGTVERRFWVRTKR